MSTDFALGHQLSLSSRRRFDEGARRRGDGFGRLQDLLLEIQRLISLLKRKTHVSSDAN